MGTLANGIKEIFATAKTTGSNVMLCGNDGTPDGHMTMSNLASVLGGLYPHGNTYSDDMNLLVDTGIYFCWYGANFADYNAPWRGNTQVQVMKTDDDKIIQVFYNYYDGLRMFWRYKHIYWHEWAEITEDMPTFYKNYNSLSSLANALGEIPVYTTPSISSSVTESIMFTFNEISNYGVRLEYTLASEEAAYIISKRSNGTGICILFRPMSGVSQIFIGYIANGSITWRYI